MRGPLLWVGTNPGGGGTETHMITLLRALAGQGVECHALVHPQGKIAAALAASPVQLHPGIFHNSADPRGIAALDRALRQLRPQLLVGSFSKEYWPLALLSRLHRIPLLLFRHMDLRLRPSTRWLLSHWPLRLVAISRYLQQRLRAQGIPAARVEYLPNPVRLADFVPPSGAREARRAELGIGDEVFLLGYVGAWHRGKGIFTLADAIDAAHEQDSRIHGLWIGGGAHEAEFRQYLAGKPWQHLLGWTDAVTPWYGAMDALALPSVEPDTFGRVLVEAQAAGLPVLGAEIGGIPEAFAPGKSGLLLPPGEVGAWREAILALAQDLAMRTRLAEEGPVFVQRFAAQRVAEEFLRSVEAPRSIA
ncbi:glycosyltransferase family 4 protein [Acidithiobacillus sp. AMEEHan]|uniref:glycosyltransferase family 4 protein n=1 Tax=Acidithiobacillus sp. AMEEHan TaxID=2994951 RepID=UPI0027E473C9|nr:glycosyltransferase family 4 protein [Acidithiobacillus sp. AMEEHan]